MPQAANGNAPSSEHANDTGAGLDPGTSELSMVPTTTVEVASDSEAKKVLRLIEALDDHDDVQNVYANFDIPDAVMAAYEG